MVGIVIVSHSEALAEAAAMLAREMGGEAVVVEAAGGLEEPGVLGTDAERVRAAIERALSDDGVLVLMDLGSALMSAEFALEMLGDAVGQRVRLTDAPLVEGAVAAAAAAAGGAPLDEVVSEARGALRMKSSQLGDSPEAAPDDQGAPAPDEGGVHAELAVENAAGLHARPAARIVEIARRFNADVRLGRPGTGQMVSARSLTNVIALGVRRGDALVVQVTGAEAGAALEAMRKLAAEGFGEGVVADGGMACGGADEVPEATGSGSGPPAPGELLRGMPASGGIAAGPVRHLRAATDLPVAPDRPPESPERERERLADALAAARVAVARDRHAVAVRASADEAAIFDAHLALLHDDALLEPALEAIARGRTADVAAHDAVTAVADVYRGLRDPLLRERAVDVLDVGRRILSALGTTAPKAAPPAPAEPAVIVAAELTPADAAALDPRSVLGIATVRGAPTAHGAILARGLGLPAVVGLGEPALGIPEGSMVLLDGDAGTLLLEPSDEVRHAAAMRGLRQAAWRADVRASAREPAVTRDGTRIEVWANLGASGAAEAVSLGAEGIGLLRTEFLYLERAELPSEDEQTATLRQIAAALEGRPLVIRTLDAGADKPLPGLPMRAEANPFLGVRGIRASLARRDVLAAQLRAILRVADEYPEVRAMLPMVSTASEVREVRAMLDQARHDTGGGTALPLGIMVEVPAAALGAARLAEHADFFSLGTNDLTQYTMAAERGDERLAALLTGPQPAVLRLVQETVRAAAARARPVAVCGELAGDPAAAVLLVGLGVTELSTAPSRIPEIKAVLRNVSLADARAVAREAVDAQDADEVRRIVAALLPQGAPG